MLSFNARLIIKNAEGEFLFLLQTKRNGGKFSLVGGTVERNEFARKALCREAKEEVGITILPEDLQLVHTMHRHVQKKGDSIVALYFEAYRYFGVPASMEPKKFATVDWLDPLNLPTNLSPFTRQAVRNISSKIPYSEYTGRKIELAKTIKQLTDKGDVS